MNLGDGRVVVDLPGDCGYIVVWQPQNEERLSREVERSLLTQAQMALTRELFKRDSRRTKQERVLRFTEKLREGEGSE